jgi:protein-tyrosine phosphatase
MSFITESFGTPRGLVRLGLAYGEVALGQGAILRPVPESVQRLVFVCHGNICRSAFAHTVARDLGLNAASFGMSTDTGRPAYGPAREYAQTLGLDLSNHRAVRAEDFVPVPGDLLLTMETRQLRRLARDPLLRGLPRTLLGLYASPPVPHLHDPYHLDPAYLPVCLARIRAAVTRLAIAFPGAKLST